MTGDTAESNDGEVAIEGEDDLHFVTEIENLGSGERILVDIEEQEIGVFNVDGEIFALANWCAHQGGPICEGPTTGTFSSNEDFELVYSHEDQVVICPWHGWEFDIKTGDHLAPTRIRIPSYEVVLQEGKIYVKTR